MKIVDHDSYYQFNFPNQEGFPLNLKEQVHIIRDILLASNSDMSMAINQL